MYIGFNSKFFSPQVQHSECTCHRRIYNPKRLFRHYRPFALNSMSKIRYGPLSTLLIKIDSEICTYINWFQFQKAWTTMPCSVYRQKAKQKSAIANPSHFGQNEGTTRHHCLERFKKNCHDGTSSPYIPLQESDKRLKQKFFYSVSSV